LKAKAQLNIAKIHTAAAIRLLTPHKTFSLSRSSVLVRYNFATRSFERTERLASRGGFMTARTLWKQKNRKECHENVKLMFVLRPFAPYGGDRNVWLRQSARRSNLRQLQSGRPLQEL